MLTIEDSFKVAVQAGHVPCPLCTIAIAQCGNQIKVVWEYKALAIN